MHYILKKPQQTTTYMYLNGSGTTILTSLFNSDGQHKPVYCLILGQEPVC